MGRGRKPKPTAIKILEGNPGKRPLNDLEPQPNSECPECPDWLTDEAKEEWHRIAPELHKIGVLTYIDMAALAGYCESFAQWRRAVEYLKKNGDMLIMYNEDGSIKYQQQAPHVAIASNALKHMRAFASEFGLTPASRSKLSVKPQADKTELEELLQG
jgi:P27 family predicted phage terminase small subunit